MQWSKCLYCYNRIGLCLYCYNHIGLCLYCYNHIGLCLYCYNRIGLCLYCYNRIGLCLYCYNRIDLWLRISSQAISVCFGGTLVATPGTLRLCGTQVENSGATRRLLTTASRTQVWCSNVGTRHTCWSASNNWVGSLLKKFLCARESLPRCHYSDAVTSNFSRVTQQRGDVQGDGSNNNSKQLLTPDTSCTTPQHARGRPYLQRHRSCRLRGGGGIVRGQSNRALSQHAMSWWERVNDVMTDQCILKLIWCGSRGRYDAEFGSDSPVVLNLG